MADSQHKPVKGGFECDCGETRRTPLGIERHRQYCQEVA